MADQPRVLPNLLKSDYAEELMTHWRNYPGYALSSDGGTATGRVVARNLQAMPPAARCGADSISSTFAPRTGARHDAATNFVRTGGRLGNRREVPDLRAARTNYFRATYVAGRAVYCSEVLDLLHHPSLAEAASALYGANVVVPNQVYANVMLPGQELGVHTDVPAFRGAHRGNYPLWLLVAMHHSRLFDAWRIRLATAVLHLGQAKGGEFAYYPGGASSPVTVREPHHNQALVLDTDTVFHGVDRVGGDEAALTKFRSGLFLRFDHASGTWQLGDGREVVATFGVDAPRYSISWKAQCFVDEADADACLNHADDLTFEQVIGSLTEELRRRGLVASRSAIDDDALARLMIEEFIRFPPAGERFPEPAQRR